MAARLSWVQKGAGFRRGKGGGEGPTSVAGPRLVRLGLCALLVALGACDKARSSGPPAPDFAGTWDVAFEDGLDVELRRGENTLRGRVDGQHGTLRFDLPEGGQVSLTIDCASPEVECPAEVLARELKLDSGAPGTLDEEGVQLAKPLAGLGRGACVSEPGSFLTAEVLSSSPQPGAVRPEALALTSGRAGLIVSAACFAPNAPAAKDMQVVIASGFTAAKR